MRISFKVRVNVCVWCLCVCVAASLRRHMCVCVSGSVCVCLPRLPLSATEGLSGLGRTAVATSSLSHEQMAKQMILAHLTHDHPYLFHGGWPTVSLSTPSPAHRFSMSALARGGLPMRASV